MPTTSFRQVYNEKQGVTERLALGLATLTPPSPLKGEGFFVVIQFSKRKWCAKKALL